MADAPANRSPIVVKVGGGLLRRDGLDGLRRGCADAAGLARSRPVLIVPGGGAFADVVRGVDRQVGLSETLAHRLALSAMDQLGRLLAELLPAAAEPQTQLMPPAGLRLLLAAPAFADRPEIPESWDVTSDSLAVYAAAAIGALVAVLLKPVAGLFEPWPRANPTDRPIPKLTAAALGELQGRGDGRAVDRHLPHAIDRTGVVVVVRQPCGPDEGTVITPR